MKQKTDYVKLIHDPNLSKEYKKLAKKTIIKDLFDNNIKGNDRMVDLEFYEDEKVFLQFGPFVPGCFYIFRHDGEILKNMDGKEFHDVVPIFLVLSVENRKSLPSVFGINFNVITKPVRAAILQELYNMDSKFFDNLWMERFKGKHTFSKRIVSAFVKDSGMSFCNYICQKYKIKKDSIAFRRYFNDNISKCRLIDYWQWKYLPFLDIDEGIRGINLAKLQKESIN